MPYKDINGGKFMAESKILTYKDLLWTNPNPSSGSFTDTTISLDLSKYRYVEVWYRDGSYVGGYKTINIEIGVNIYIFSSTGPTCARQCVTTTSSIRFYTGVSYGAYGGNSATSSGAIIIPYKIYGVK